MPPRRMKDRLEFTLHTPASCEGRAVFSFSKGGSQSHLLLGEDNHPYVVKFLGNPQHDRVLINEWVGASLARTLDLPVPKTALIQVSADFLREHPEVCANVSGRTRPYEPGIHFGSQFAGGLMPGLTTDLMPKALSARVANRTQFLGALVFDKWTCNADGRQAVFTKTGTHFVASFIDQGYCFDAEFWTMKRCSPQRPALEPRRVQRSGGHIILFKVARSG